MLHQDVKSVLIRSSKIIAYFNKVAVNWVFIPYTAGKLETINSYRSTVVRTNQEYLQLLVEKVVPIIGEQASIQTDIPGLRFYFSDKQTVPLPCMHMFGVGAVLQGEKTVMVGDDVFQMKAGECTVSSADLPVVTSVVSANTKAPYVGMWLELDFTMLAQLVLEETSQTTRVDQSDSQIGLGVITLDTGILDAFYRLVSLLEQPALKNQLYPLIQKEVIVRTLQSEFGHALRQLIAVGSPIHRIAKVLTWLRDHFRESIVIDDLAARSHMSPSSFRQHFKTVTGLSPLQYVKQLRLMEARQSMLEGHYDAATAAIHVGYESPSQFSREYTRLFGQPPIKDITQLRAGNFL